MQCEIDDIRKLTTDVFSLTLGLDLAPGDVPPPATDGRMIEGCVHVTGAWSGAVVLICRRPLADRVAQIMLSLGSDEPSLLDVQDAFGEITNMVGGNIKGLSEAPCFLSLPSVIEGSDYQVRIPGTRVMRKVAFECQGEPLLVHLLAAVPRDQST
jgi:chemotaxis protein CheX